MYCMHHLLFSAVPPSYSCSHSYSFYYTVVTLKQISTSAWCLKEPPANNTNKRPHSTLGAFLSADPPNTCLSCHPQHSNFIHAPNYFCKTAAAGPQEGESTESAQHSCDSLPQPASSPASLAYRRHQIWKRQSAAISSNSSPESYAEVFSIRLYLTV